MSGNWLALKLNMEYNHHLSSFLSTLCQRHYSIMGAIDIDKDVFGYGDNEVLHFCDSTGRDLDRKDYGINDDIVMLYESFDCTIHIAEDGDKIANPGNILIIDKSNKLLYSKKKFFSGTDDEFLRINSDSVVLFEEGSLKDFCQEYSDTPCIKEIYKKELVENQKSVIILNGVVQRNYKLLLIYNEYYFFWVDNRCKIFHSEKGFLHEGEFWIFWLYSPNQPFLIEKHIYDGENKGDGDISLSTIEGEVLSNYHLYNNPIEKNITYRSEDSACSANYLVLKLLGNWVILQKQPYNVFSAIIKSIDRANMGKLKMSTDFFFLDDMMGWAYLYDLDGNYVGHYPTSPSSHYSIYQRKTNLTTYYGVLRLDNFTIAIQPIYSKIKYLSNKDSLLRVFTKGAEYELEGVVSPEHGQVVPFGCNYHFAAYNNIYYTTPFRIVSDVYLIYEIGGLKGLVFQGKNVLGAEYDDILGFDYSFDLGEFQEDDNYINCGITAQWAPDGVILKKNCLYGLFIDEKTIILPIYETMDYITNNKTTCYFLAKKHGDVYLINNIDGILFNVSSNYSFVTTGQYEESLLFVFKSIITNEYKFVDYFGNTLTFSQINDKTILANWNLRQLSFDVEKEKFIYRKKTISDSEYIDYDYTQDELNDMYRDAFEGSPEYESNVD